MHVRFTGMVVWRSLFAAALALAYVGGDVACAQQGSQRARLEPAPAITAHQSTLQIGASEPLPQTRSVTVARNKSMVVEVPRELRDVIVSAPDVLDAVVQSSSRVYLIGKKDGQANVLFFDNTGEQILTLEVNIDQDTGTLDTLLTRLIPGSNIKAEIINGNVILSGSVHNPIDSSRAADLAGRFAGGPTKVLNMISVDGDDQVMLKVTVAEVQRSMLKQLGINLGAIVNSGSFSTAVLTSNSLPLTAGQGLGGLPTIGVATATAGACTVGALCITNGSGNFANSGIAGGWKWGNQQIAQTIRALEEDGVLRTLAEPNLTAVSGESAKFLAGGEYPIPTVDSNGQTSVTFKEFGIGLAFTPLVLTQGRISLKIETEVSELTDNGAVKLSNISIPALTKRQAKSTVEIPSGGSIALAGLISDSLRQNVDGMPGLKEIPVLGTLFRSRDFIHNETELVVIVTPYVVRAVQRDKLARPDDGFSPPSDRDSNFLGHLNKVYGRPVALPRGSLKDDYGFIVE